MFEVIVKVTNSSPEVHEKVSKALGETLTSLNAELKSAIKDETYRNEIWQIGEVDTIDITVKR